MRMIGTLAPRTQVHVTIGSMLAEAIGRGWLALRLWARILVTRRDLQDMDDRMLSDLGISRAQAKFELARAPWEVRRSEADGKN